MTVLAPQRRVQIAHRPPFLVDFRAGDLFLPTGEPAIEHDAFKVRSGQEMMFTRDGRAYSVDQAGRLGLVPKNTPRVGIFGGLPHLLLEDERTNLCLRSEELGTTWVASNVTVSTDDVVAPDGATTAEKLTANAADGTLIQDLGTLSSDAYVFSIWLKRVTGSGDIDLTLDNGSTWTTVTVTSSWARYSLTRNLQNPDAGVRIVTSGDAVHAWGADVKALPFADSYVKTEGSTAARAAETISMPFAALTQPITIYLKFVERGTVLGADSGGLFHLGAAASGTDPRISVRKKTGSNIYQVIHDNGTSSATADASGTPSVGDVVELLILSPGSGTNLSIEQSINGAASTTGSGTDVAHFGAAWGGGANLLYLGSLGTSNRGLTKLREFRLALGIKTLDDMRVAQ